jgi:hypothetical protein
MTESTKAERSIYALCWDQYVKNWYKTSVLSEGHWPGDEWGTPDFWDHVFAVLFSQAGVKHWKRAVEIGAGAGKYTSKVLTVSQAEIRAYDVSQMYLNVCGERCKEWVDHGRLRLIHLGIERASQMLEDLEGCGWGRQVDGFYSIDAMVHVDLQYLIAYMLTAALVLRPGGMLILTLADVTTDCGFQLMMDGLHGLFPAQASSSGSPKFEWLSPEIVGSVLPRLGFRIDSITHENTRDIFMRATLVDPQKAEVLRSSL